MTFQPAVDCAEAVINATVFGKPIANVLNFQFPGPYSQSDLDNLSSLIDGLVDTLYLPNVASSVSYVNTTVKGLTSLIDKISIDSTNAGPGLNSGTPNPPNTTMCFRLGTGLTGRSARGRFYAFPAGSSALADSAHFISTWADAIVNFLNNIASGATGVGCDMVVLSRFTAGAPRLAAVTTVITSIDYRNLAMDSQRGRLPAGH